MTIQKLIDLNNETNELLLKVALDEYAKEIIKRYNNNYVFRLYSKYYFCFHSIKNFFIYVWIQLFEK